MQIKPEAINRIRLSGKEMILLEKLLRKVDAKKLSSNEKKFYDILSARVKGRLRLKSKGVK